MYKVPRTERVMGWPVKCYDNGGKTADRYTVLYVHPVNYTKPEWGNPRSGYEGIGMSADPFHPQGVGNHFEFVMPGPHLGKKICFADLPDNCRKAVEQDIRDYLAYVKRKGIKL